LRGGRRVTGEGLVGGSLGHPFTLELNLNP